MQFYIPKIPKKRFAVLAMILFFSCEDSTSTLKQINRFNENPVGIAYDIQMTYTDSAKVKAILTAPVNLDYTHLSFKYSEFPDGLKIIFYNDQDKENTVVANYGILYNQTKIVDLKGNVILFSHDGLKIIKRTSHCYLVLEERVLISDKSSLDGCGRYSSFIDLPSLIYNMPSQDKILSANCRFYDDDLLLRLEQSIRE